MEIYCLVSIDSKFINVKGEGTCDVNPPTVVTFCMESTHTVYIVLTCMVIQFFIHFIECVHLLHLSTAECMEKGWL